MKIPLSLIVEQFDSFWEGLSQDERKATARGFADLAVKLSRVAGQGEGVSMKLVFEDRKPSPPAKTAVKVVQRQTEPSMTAQEAADKYGVSAHAVMYHRAALKKIGERPRGGKNGGRGLNLYSTASVDKLAASMGWEPTLATPEIRKQAEAGLQSKS